MKYETAKDIQFNEFKRGTYLVLREEQDRPGEFYLVPTSKEKAEEDITRAALAAVKRLPTRLRLITGGRAR